MTGRVLVTGGSGFLGSHVILGLLQAGHAVNTTLRDPRREAEVRAMIARGGQVAGDRLGVFEADLVQDRGWDRAMAGCSHVIHVASPFPQGVPKDEDALIVPAREGTLRVLRAARAAGVRRVVMTSSFAAIGYGHARRGQLFTEADWTDVSGADVQPYIKSKTLAERAGWDFVAREPDAPELSVINPVGIFGPVLGPDLSSSVAIVKRMLEGMSAVPRVHFGVVDVRDLATLHLMAMQAAQARGQRFLAVGDGLTSLHAVAQILRRHLGPAAGRVPRRQTPDWLLRLAAPFRPEARAVLPQLGILRHSSSAKARSLLGWQPRPLEETIVETARSLLALGLVT